MLDRWHEAHSWPLLAADFWPKTGVIISNGDNDLAAAFLYRTDSPICWIENIISNPRSAKMERRAAIDMLIDTLAAEAKNSGFKAVLCMTEHRRLMQAFEEAGFTELPGNMTGFMREL